jgi:hypothetical protein
MLFHHFDLGSVTDHLPLLRLCSIRRNVRKAQLHLPPRPGRQLLSTITRDLIDTHRRDTCYLPPVSVEPLGFLFQPAVVHPIEKSPSKLPENRRLAWKRIGVFRGRS